MSLKGFQVESRFSKFRALERFESISKYNLEKMAFRYVTREVCSVEVMDLALLYMKHSPQFPDRLPLKAGTFCKLLRSYILRPYVFLKL